MPKKKAGDKGVAFTNTFNPLQTAQALSLPTYREHLDDLFVNRPLQDSRQILQDLFKQDPDVSAAVNAYLTVANTDPIFYVRDMEGVIDREGHKLLQQIITGLTTRSDYSTGFQMTQSLRSIAESMRYMLLLRGGIATELVFDKFLIPREFRHVDMATLEWFETAPGKFVPVQEPKNSQDPISLDQPTFFVSFYRRDPTTIYTYSPFVSAVNTIAARQQVINDLYRIMQKTGYPRIEASVVEEVLRKNAPASAKDDETEMLRWLADRLNDISTTLGNMRPDQAFVHSDTIVTKILNPAGPGKSMDVTSVIGVLNAQNQAALKTMATIIGRGEAGVNTASTEARIFAMNAEELNHPIAETLGHMFTLALRMQGFQGYVDCRFKKIELRPDMELEPQRLAKQARLIEMLSLGLIGDDDFHMMMFDRVRPDEIEEMTGTGFAGSAPGMDTDSISPNADPLGRSLAPSGSKATKSNQVKK